MSDSWSTFFDPKKARGPRRGPDVGDDDGRSGPDAGDGGKDAPLSVSHLLRRVKDTLSSAFPRSIYVVGQISNFKLHSSGHMYFRLKDSDAAVDAAMFRSAAAKLKFMPEDGLEVVARGHVDVYEVRGQLQFYVRSMVPKGAGALELAFRQLCEKLRREGLFDPSIKKSPPRFPRAVGIVTSPTGAAIRDIRRTLARRWPGARVFLLPVAVQGEGSAAEIARAVSLLDSAADDLRIDTIIVARGGGSLEDLWAFNEEVIARAIFDAETPIISGVGHEIDITICDLAADVRAATPTAAAELAVPDRREVSAQLDRLSRRIEANVGSRVATAQTALDGMLRSVVFRDPASRVRTQAQRVDELSHRLRAGLGGVITRGRKRLEPTTRRLAGLHPARLAVRARARVSELYGRLRWVLAMRSKRCDEALAATQRRLAGVHPRNRLALARQQVSAIARQLEAMSYRSVLERGYSVTRRADGLVIRSRRQAPAGERIETEVADGKFKSVVGAEDAQARRRESAGGSKPRRKHEGDLPGLFD